MPALHISRQMNMRMIIKLKTTPRYLSLLFGILQNIGLWHCTKSLHTWCWYCCAYVGPTGGKASYGAPLGPIGGRAYFRALWGPTGGRASLGLGHTGHMAVLGICLDPLRQFWFPGTPPTPTFSLASVLWMYKIVMPHLHISSQMNTRMKIKFKTTTWYLSLLMGLCKILVFDTAHAVLILVCIFPGTPPTPTFPLPPCISCVE